MTQLRNILASLLLLFLLTASALGAERVTISATKSGSYDVEKQIFLAEGDVTILAGDLTLKGQHLQVDFGTGQLWLQGDVSLNQEDQEVRGETLLYNLETGEGTFQRAKAEIPLAEGTGSIFLFGQAIDLAGDTYTVQRAEFTTCDLPQSHFHVATKELEVILGERIIIRGVTYYEGKIPLFYWPYLVIPLNTSDTEPFFNLPEFGYGEYEGYYMKNSFNYYFNDKSYGKLYVDLFSRLGVATGFLHTYDLSDFGKGSFSLYGLPSQLSSLMKGTFQHEWSKDSLALKTNSSYENSWLRQETSSQNRLTFTKPQLTAQAWYNYKSNPALQVKKEQQYGASWAQQLSDKWRLNLQGTWTKRESGTALSLFDYVAETTYRQGKHTLALALQQQYNSELITGGSQLWHRVNRIPELKWDVSDLGLPSVPLRSQLIVGRYEESPSLVKETRLYGQLSLKPKVWKPFDATSLTYQGDLSGALYGDGQKQASTLARITLSQKLLTGLQLSSTYTRRDVWGTSPFRFDNQKAAEDLSLRLNYTDPKWQASLSSSYNFQTKKYGTVVLQTRYRPTQAWNLNLYGYYDIKARQVLRAVPLLEYKQGQLDVRLGARYRPTDQVVERLDARIGLPLGTTWQVSYDSIYEPPKGAFSSGTLTVTKDLHCRTLSVSWDHVQGRVALQYTINAFPSLPIGWDSQGGFSLFDLEDVADIIGIKE